MLFVPVGVVEVRAVVPLADKKLPLLILALDRTSRAMGRRPNTSVDRWRADRDGGSGGRCSRPGTVRWPRVACGTACRSGPVRRLIRNRRAVGSDREIAKADLVPTELNCRATTGPSPN